MDSILLLMLCGVAALLLHIHSDIQSIQKRLGMLDGEKIKQRYR